MNPSNKSLLSLCALDIMTPQVVTIPGQMSMQAAARLLARAGVTGAPIVDADGRCVGVVSATDFMHWVETNHGKLGTRESTEEICSAWQIPECSCDTTSRVEDHMTKNSVLVGAGARIAELARMMMDAHVHRLIVVEWATQRPIGIVSSMDILAAVARSDAGSAEDAGKESATAGAMY